LFLAPLALFGCRSRAPTDVQRPHVLLVTIDTWRADRLGVGVSPALDRLAASSIRFTAARTAAPLTLPSHTTILTGLLPPAHGVRVNGAVALRRDHVTIAQLLKNAGYQTAAFIGAFVLDRRFGLDAGFDSYDDRIPRDPRASERLEAERPAAVVVDRALAWLDANAGTGPGGFAPPDPPSPSAAPPFFIWIHLYDPHAPYTPPPEFLERARELQHANATTESAAYDGEIAYADSQFARVFAWLGRHRIADRTLLVVAGDHGEGLGEHGERTHGMLVYDSTLRVPLIVAAPGRRAAVREDAVSLADIAPTILAAAGVPRRDEMRGRDLIYEIPASIVSGSSRTGTGRQPDVYSETEYPRSAGWTPLQALTDGRWMTIRAGSVTEVYDLKNDPHQERNVAATQTSVANAMIAGIESIRAAAAKPAAADISNEARERLRALGYVAGGSSSEIPADAPNPAAEIDAWNRFEDGLSLLQTRPREALAVLAPLARAHPESAVFQTTAARALKETGRVDQALALYRSAASRWPTDPALFHDLAVAARDASQAKHGAAAGALRDEAEQAERVAVALSPTTATAHNGLGLLAIDAGRIEDAAAEFERAAASDPNNASYLANLGNARRALGDRAAAEKAYRQALDISPQTADAANGLGVLLVEARRPGEAVAWFERALASAPDLVEARLNLGIALQESGQLVRAAEEYRRVLAAAGASREKEAATKLLGALHSPGASRSRPHGQ